MDVGFAKEVAEVAIVVGAVVVGLRIASKSNQQLTTKVDEFSTKLDSTDQKVSKLSENFDKLGEDVVTLTTDLAVVKNEITLNSGRSVKDTVVRIDERVLGLKEQLDRHVLQETAVHH